MNNYIFAIILAIGLGALSAFCAFLSTKPIPEVTPQTITTMTPEPLPYNYETLPGLDKG